MGGGARGRRGGRGSGRTVEKHSRQGENSRINIGSITCSCFMTRRGGGNAFDENLGRSSSEEGRSCFELAARKGCRTALL